MIEPEEKKEELRDIEEDEDGPERSDEVKRAIELIIEMDDELSRIDNEEELDAFLALKDYVEELEAQVKNMTYEKDCEYDRAEKLSDEVSDLEDRLSDLESSSEETEEELKDAEEVIEIVRKLRESYNFLNMGNNNNEIDRIINLTNDLLNIYDL